MDKKLVDSNQDEQCIQCVPAIDIVKNLKKLCLHNNLIYHKYAPVVDNLCYIELMICNGSLDILC